jgi:hypothetical protein
MRVKRLHLRVNPDTFKRIKSGEFKHITKPSTSYWVGMIEDRANQEIVIHNSYKPGPINQIRFPWRGFQRVELIKGMEFLRVELEK